MHHQYYTGATVITIAGEIDLASAGRLRQYLAEVAWLPAEHLILDMTDVAFMDSTGLSVLLTAYTAARQHGGMVHLAGLHGAPARLIEITRLTDHFRLHPNTSTALAALTTG
ncbi:STAS domain-containing protein [Nonomuraea sp. NPDC049684]|uniref:STAS domain-containing protein n=1 Tax=unclassified Nonomuraea TaxID=2593643 RepID=UPI0037A4DA29